MEAGEAGAEWVRGLAGVRAISYPTVRLQATTVCIEGFSLLN
jgi:hypothetical protein